MPVESLLQLLLALEILLGYFVILMLPMFNTVDFRHRLDDMCVMPLAGATLLMTLVAIAALVV
jgi:hypothetical protein